MRGFIEEFSDNCRFILTCNFKNKIIEPLHSRCSVYEFTNSKKVLADLCGQFMGRLSQILDDEGISYTNEVIAELIMRYAPDWRRVLNEAQRHSIGGSLEASVLVSNGTGAYEDLYSYLKGKDFKKMRSWVVNHIDLEPAAIYRGIYDSMEGKVASNSIPQLVLILADYQYKNAFVADHELNLVACLTECMANVEYV